MGAIAMLMHVIGQLQPQSQHGCRGNKRCRTLVQSLVRVLGIALQWLVGPEFSQAMAIPLHL